MERGSASRKARDGERDGSDLRSQTLRWESKQGHAPCEVMMSPFVSPVRSFECVGAGSDT